MKLSGNNTLQLPEVNAFSFIFDNLSVSTTGISKIAFSTQSGVTGFSFVLSGQNIYLQSSGINKSISSYNINESFSISGNNLSGVSGYNYLDFYVNGLGINAWQELLPQNLYLLNINVASGDVLNLNAKLYAKNININLNLPNSYQALGGTTGTINTDTSFWITNSNTVFSQSYQPLLNIDTIIAPVKVNNPLSLVLTDLDDSSQDYTMSIQSYLSSNIGPTGLLETITRTGNVASTISSFELLNNNFNVSGLFDGIWSGNNFVYSDFPEYSTFNFEYSIMDTLGNYSSNQSILIKFEPSTPVNGSGYTSEYITGFNLITGGKYLYPPTPVFNSYYFVTGLTQSFASMLFSSGCTGSIPVTFTGGGGNGASGDILLAGVTLANLYQSGNLVYYIATGANFPSQGTNYTGIPTAIFKTGIYSNCYDVPAHFASNLYSFTSLNSSGSLGPQAVSLSGLVLTNTGVFSGITGFTVTGLDITNMGHGYNASRMPLVTFLRQSGDTLTGNASGTFQLKATGLYNINNFWTIQTGWTNGDFAPLQSGLSGILTNNQRFFSIQLQCSGLDNTTGIVSKLSVLPSQGSGIVQLVTGTKYYSDDPYFLKKKLNPIETLVPISGDLSFLTTQSDLDNLYNDFVSSEGIDLGDFDF